MSLQMRQCELTPATAAGKWGFRKTLMIAICKEGSKDRREFLGPTSWNAIVGDRRCPKAH
jgi:hypothetical protein